ncbi:hypothetical protein BpHYR1_023599 [Brachionus plicatilis]|uniref:Endonuclease/exonuclease/phosphatase domain-containing protein n=1 Tax=Brachionus plicatilis TaxID=10195 RepID=A0A3M7QY64_BRAPC|nr:hypothetical protein BpHYR1_023599 [Brachionus plicatilis]
MYKNYKKPFSVMHWNCNSFRNKKDLLIFELETQDPDIVLLNEIKLKESQAVSLLNVPGYRSIFKCRNSSRGGVAIRQNTLFTILFV